MQQKFGRDNPARPQTARLNEQIRISPIRVIKDGTQLGVMPTSQALRLAQDDGLDLVEVDARARPPVCRIMDYGKHRFEESLRDKENRRRQRSAQDKVIWLSPVVDDHDLDTKVGQARSFLGEGKKVQFVLRFKGRLIVHKDKGFDVLSRVVALLADVSQVEGQTKLDGKTLTCRVTPRKGKQG